MLTPEEIEERRVERNKRRRDLYHGARVSTFEITYAKWLQDYSQRDVRLLKGVFRAHRLVLVDGMQFAQAEWILENWQDGQPKVGWRDIAREIIEAAKEKDDV